MNAVVLDHQTKGGERLLLFCLARYAADDGSRVFPSVATLSDETQQTRRAVQYQLRSLEAKGLLKRLGDSDYGTTDYCIAVDKLTGAHDVRPQKRKASAKGAQMPTERGALRSPESSSIRQENRQELLATPHVKSPKGVEAMKTIEAFLPKFKSASREAK
jgi:hypothetical protein